MGPLARLDLRAQLDSQVQRSIEMGAKCILGGSYDSDETGFFYSPTVLTETNAKMPVINEETFGPVASIQSFSSDQEAVYLANQSCYGLGASLWGKDRAHLQQVAQEVEAGNICINQMVSSDPAYPFGGVKSSGFGRELGREGVIAFSNIKVVR